LGILVVVAIVAAAAAAWTASGVINAPTPTLAADSYETVLAQVDTENTSVVSSRSDSLAKLEPGVSAISDFGGPAESQVDVRRHLESARSRALEALAEESPISGLLPVGGTLPSSAVIDNALDQADALYQQRVTEGTDTTLAIYQDLMNREFGDIPRRLAYRTLAMTVDRYVLWYRDHYSLDINSAKSTLYHNQSDTINSGLDSMKAGAEENLAAENRELDSKYSELLSALIATTVHQWSEEGTATSDSGKRAAVIAFLSEHLSGFSPAEFTLVPGPQPGAFPVVDNSTWAGREGELTREFSDAARK
jgi:hypothetical protein